MWEVFLLDKLIKDVDNEKVDKYFIGVDKKPISNY
jgi:hypothetical protein